MAVNFKKTQPALKDYFSADHLKSGLTGRALRGASLTVAGQISSFVIQTAGTILLARLLTPDDFGLVTMVVSFSLLLQNFGGNGFIEAIVQRKEINHAQISTLFWVNAVLSLLLALVFIAAAPLIALIYHEPRLKPIVAVMASSIFFGGLSNQHVSLLTRNMQFFERTANEVSAAFASIAAAIALAWWGLGYWALVAKWIISPLMIAVGAWILCDWRPGPPSRADGVRQMMRFAVNTYGNFVMSYFRRNADKILVGRFFGPQLLGFYDRAYHLSNMLPVQILTPLNSVSLAAFSRLSDDREKYRSSYLKVLSVLAFVGMPLGAALTLISDDVILLVLGPQWSNAGAIFRAFGPSIGIIIIYITHGWLHLSLGTPDRWFRWSIVEFAVTLLCFLIGLRFGPIGVAVAMSVSFYLLIGPALWYAGKPVSLSVSSIAAVLWRPYVSALLAAALCWFLFYGPGPLTGMSMHLRVIARIALAVLSCISIYLVFVIAFHRGFEPIAQFRSVLKEMLKRKSQEDETPQ